MSITLNGTTGLAGTNGSAGTPAVQGEDTNTGIFFPAADTVAVATGGAERLRVDSSGNVGIGTSSPTSLGTGITTLELKGNSASQTDRAGGINFMRYDGNPGMYIYHADDASYIDSRSTYPLLFYTNGTERARIDANGTLLVGATDFSNLTGGSTAGCALQAAGTVWGARADASGVFNRLTSNGVAVELRRQGVTVGSISVTTTATAYNTSSDYRLKENVAPMQNALDTVAQLNPVTYTWKADGSAGQGFIAHELQAVVPDCVTGEKDAVDAEGNPQYQGVDTSFLVATLVKAIQELTARVAELEARQ